VAVFAAMGGKALKVLSAGSWNQVPARVISSDVRSHRGDDSTTYSVNILYAYSIDGREYRSNRYGFMNASSSGYRGKKEIVRRYPAGTRFTAYVNPSDPTEAVIERGFTKDMFLLLVPAAFMGVGGIGIYYSARHAVRARLAAQLANGDAPVSGRFVRPMKTSAPEAGRLNMGRLNGLTLRPRHSPVAKIVGVTFICLFWNGIVSIFLYQVIKSWANGRGEVCLTVFLIPFVAVGVGLVFGVFYSLLALFNPRCALSLEKGQLALGEAVEMRWTFDGRYDRIHRLVLRVEGREEATYRQGTNTHTDKNVFYVLDLIDTTRALDIRAGKARWNVPAETMHSFSAPNNKIVWVLILHGHIQGWPDVKEEYPLTVGPLGAQRRVLSQVKEEDPSAESAPQAGRLNQEDSAEENTWN
jgi:hypothetical protein